jgi:conjugal transfer ATP-binding protein TraC
MSMLNALKEVFTGQEDPDAVPEAMLNDPANPQFSKLSTCLNYSAYDDVNDLFMLDYFDGKKSTELGVGFVVEINPLIGADDDVMSRLASVFHILPKNVGVQVTILGSPNIEPFLAQYVANQSAREGDDTLGSELFLTLAKKRADWWRQGSKGQLYQGNPMRFREFRVNMSITFHDADLSNSSDVQVVLEARENLIGGLKASGMYDGTWRANDLLKWTRDLVNPSRMLYDENRQLDDVYDEGKSLRDQIVFSSTSMKILNDGNELRFGRRENGDAVSVRCLSVNQYPSGRPHHLSNMGSLIGDPIQNNLNYTCPFLITMNMYKGDFESDKAKITMKAARAAQNAASPMAKLLPEYAKKNEDYALVMDAFEDGSGGVVKLFHQVVLFDHPDTINASVNAAQAIWRTNGFSLAKDQFLQFESFLSCLPMSLDKDFMKGLNDNKRFSTKTMLNAVALSPMIGQWAGLGKPMLGLFGRNGQAMGIDLFANPSGNYNAVVVGTPGSGKSFFINEIVRNYLGSGAQVWVIDVGRSYQKFCQFIGGQYIEFNTESDIVINPFDTVVDFAEDLNILKIMFGVMISPKDGLSDFQMSQLEKVISSVWAEHGPLAIIDHVAQMLLDWRDEDENREPDINRLGSQMFPFTSKGIHGRWFNGKTNLNFNHDLVILELEELKSKPDLQKVIMQFVLYRITQAMYLSRERHKVVAIDEAWALLDGNKEEGMFIEEGYRRARKYKGSFLTGTQGIMDYLKSPAAKAALEHSDWIFMLRGKQESIDALASRINLSPGTKSMMRSLTTESGQYSDIFIYTPVGSGIGRLVSDPFNALLSSSKGEDFEAIRLKQSQGYSIGDAVEAVLVDRGVRILK